MVENNAGGYVFTTGIWDYLDRFLILGTESPIYYASSKEITKKASNNIIKCIKEDGTRTVNRIVEISTEGRAPKNDPALFALAMCTSPDLADKETRKLAFNALNHVTRIGTHLFHFCAFREQFGGWGRGMRNAVANWYLGKDLDSLAYQIIKYQQRDGWSHRDLLRLSHPKGVEEYNDLFGYVTKKTLPSKGYLPGILNALNAINEDMNCNELLAYIKDYNLPREVIPTRFLNNPKIWEALLEKMPMTAMIRNLAKMTAVELLKPMSKAVNKVIGELTNEKRIKKARVHPIQMLSALKVYESGRGIRGSLEWEPVQQIVDALDDGFYLSFKNVTPSNKRILIGLDVSGSMGWSNIAGVPGLTPRMASAALCMITAKTEKNYHVMAFSDGFVPISISPRMRLNDIIRHVGNMPFDRTDCALPMLYARSKNIPVDAFVIYTDNETWSGRIHPVQALQQYRKATGIPAKLIVVGMTATEFTIADSKDNGMLDCVGFDSATPRIISDFIIN